MPREELPSHAFDPRLVFSFCREVMQLFRIRLEIVEFRNIVQPVRELPLTFADHGFRLSTLKVVFGVDRTVALRRLGIPHSGLETDPIVRRDEFRVC